MTITKNQKMLLGVGALAVAGYLVYQQMNKKSFAGEPIKAFAGERVVNASGRGIFGKIAAPKVNYIAGGIGVNNQGENAQWISYGGAGSAGYWYPCQSILHPRPCFPVGTVVPGWMQ